MRFIRSLSHAWRGINILFREEKNLRLECAIASMVLVASFVFPLQSYEKIVIYLLITLVLLLEMLNSVMERFLDVIKPRLSYQVGTIKDMMAGIVFFTACVACVIGLGIFIPSVVEFGRHLMIQ